MITKKQFCEMMIEDYCHENSEIISDSLVFQSSSIAVCMEYLGLIQAEEAKGYTKTRGGILYTCLDKENNKCNILSTREFIDMLPESI